MLPKKGFWADSREGIETKNRIEELLFARPKNKQHLFFFCYCLIQKEAIAVELVSQIAKLQKAKCPILRRKAFLINAFLHSHFVEKDVIEKPIPASPRAMVLEEVEVINPLTQHREIVKQSPIALRERTIFPKELGKDYGWPLNSEIVYSEITAESEKVDENLFDKEYYPRLDRRRFKSHDSDGISTYTSRAKEVSREELALDNPKDFTRSKGGIVSRKQQKPKHKKGQYLNDLGHVDEKRVADYLETERKELQEEFKGKILVVKPPQAKVEVKVESKENEIVDAYLERIRSGNGTSTSKTFKWKQKTYHSLFMERRK